jgi:hypothetical protein
MIGQALLQPLDDAPGPDRLREQEQGPADPETGAVQLGGLLRLIRRGTAHQAVGR